MEQNQLQVLLTDFGVTWSKLCIQVILFIIVYVILNKFAFGPVIKTLEERRRRIEEGQVNAEKIKRQLAEAEQRYQETLQKANNEAEALIASARQSGQALTDKAAQDAIKQAEEIIAKAKANIEIERTKMVGEVRAQMVGLVVDTTRKVTGKVLTPEDQQRLNDETTRQLAAN